MHTWSSNFFFEQGEEPRRVQTALLGGVTNYIKDHKVNANYNQVLRLYEKDPAYRKRNAIRSFTTGNSQLDAAAIDAIAGDETTWRRCDVCCRGGAGEGPPQWHSGLEVEDAMAKKLPRHGVAPCARNNGSSSSPPLMISVACSQISLWKTRTKSPIFLSAHTAA